MTNVYEKQNPESIQSLFRNIAKNYDRTNAILSFNLHKYWNSRLVDIVARRKPAQLLDLCAGTGEIGYHIWHKHRCEVSFLDFSSAMLEQAQLKKPNEGSFSFIEGDAQETGLESLSYDAITVAYGIRNVSSTSRCVREAFRLLRPGGLFAALELTRPHHKLLRFGHSLYLHHLLPMIGYFATSDKEAYEYLCKSIDNFTDPVMLKQQMQEAGFISCKVLPLTGGIATILLGFKHASA